MTDPQSRNHVGASRSSGLDRRGFLASCAAVGLGAGAIGTRATTQAATTPARAPRRGNSIGVSTYSFWQFRGRPLGMIECFDQAAAMGFDGVELLQRQMSPEDQTPQGLATLKREAHARGLALMGFSTHQGFVFADAAKRAEQVALTISQVEMAHRLGIPTMRINTGRWNTIGSFDELMANKGIEPPLPGVSEDQAFGWVIAALEEILPRAEELGVVLGLENHWGLGRTAQEVTRIVEAIESPWLQITLDTGNFLEDILPQIEAMTRSRKPITLVQAKTYFGGGRWYELDLDYARIAELLRAADYRGWISLEFEGDDDPQVAVPRSLELLRTHFG